MSKNIEDIGKFKEIKIIVHYMLQFTEITALTDKKILPIEVYSHIYLSLESGFKSRNIEALKCLDFVEEHFGKKGIYALDRGYEANMYMNILLKATKIL